MSETLEVLDRWDGGISWTLADDEVQRTSHALVVDGDAEDERAVWLVDPVDAPGLDDELADLGEVSGVVVLLDRHTRDSAAIATRHDVAVALPETLAGVADDLDCETSVFRGVLPDTDFRTIRLVDNALWREVALYDRESKTLVVAESLGTAEFFRAGGERLGVHPGLRLVPPRAKLDGLRPERILVGHGKGVVDDAPGALRDALRNSRRTAPRLYAEMLTMPFG